MEYCLPDTLGSFKEIMEHHGGNIWLESVYQQGITAYFTLLLAE